MHRGEVIDDVRQRLSMIQGVIPPECFDALARDIMKAIGAAAMREAERRSWLLNEPPPPRPARCDAVGLPRTAPGQEVGRPETARAGGMSAIGEASAGTGVDEEGHTSSGESHG